MKKIFYTVFLVNILFSSNALFGQSANAVEEYIEVVELKEHFLDSSLNNEISKNWKLKSKSDSLIIIEGTRNEGLNNSLIYFVTSKTNNSQFILSGTKIKGEPEEDSLLKIENIYEMHGDLAYGYGYCSIIGSLPKISSIENYLEILSWLEENSKCKFNSFVFIDENQTISVLYWISGVYEFKQSEKKERLIQLYYKELKKQNRFLHFQ